MLFRLLHPFTKASLFASAVMPAAKRERILNYIWLSGRRAYFQPWEREQEPLCAVPLRAIDKALANARRYPDVKVVIWLDYKELEDMSRFFIESHVYASGLKNIQLRDLRYIKAYKNSPFSNMYMSIWPRVNMARLLVLQHCLRATKAEDVCYADFDTEDARLNDRKMQAHLAVDGMVFGAIPCGMIENGYMAFRRGGEGVTFLNEHLIPSTYEATRPGNTYAWLTLIEELKKWAEARDRKDKSFGVRLLHAKDYVIPENPIYSDTGINAPAIPRIDPRQKLSQGIWTARLNIWSKHPPSKHPA